MSVEKKRKRGLNRPLEVREQDLLRQLEELRNRKAGIEIKPDLSSDPEMAEIVERMKIAQNNLAKLARHAKDGKENHDNMLARAAEWLVKQQEAENKLPAAQDLLDQIRTERDELIQQRIEESKEQSEQAGA
jgi:hypothetical protein